MKRISILIADDEAEIADLIEIHLEKKGTTSESKLMEKRQFILLKRDQSTW